MRTVSILPKEAKVILVPKGTEPSPVNHVTIEYMHSTPNEDAYRLYNRGRVEVFVAVVPKML